MAGTDLPHNQARSPCVNSKDQFCAVMDQDSSLKDFIKNIRRDFVKGQLLEKHANKDPLKQFSAWFADVAGTGDDVPARRLEIERIRASRGPQEAL